MPDFDATATAHLDSGAPTKPIFLAFFDVDGDPIRATTAGYPVTLPVLADPDLSGQTFYPTAGVSTVSDVEYRQGGSETVTAELSGLLLPDADFLAAIAARENWQGRPARLWVLLRDQSNAQQGAIAPYYSGIMSALSISPRPDQQTIKLEIEGYKALLTQPSNRSYLDQARYDPDDQSASASVGSTNGAKSGPSILGIGGDGPRIQLDAPLQ